MPTAMKALAALLLIAAIFPVLAQPGPGRPQGDPGRHMQQRDFGRQMPPAERRMGWEERQKLREQVRSGQMTREEARQQWREERARRGLEPGRSPEERERLRRDVMEANRNLERR
jgi:hypothetical protein